MIFCAKHKINLLRTDGRFFAMQKKCITFVAVNNFYSNEDEDSQ